MDPNNNVETSAPKKKKGKKKEKMIVAPRLSSFRSQALRLASRSRGCHRRQGNGEQDDEEAGVGITDGVSAGSSQSKSCGCHPRRASHFGGGVGVPLVIGERHEMDLSAAVGRSKVTTGCHGCVVGCDGV